MRFLLKAIAIVGWVTAASAAQAVPLFYDEADSGDIFARIGAIPVFNFDVGNNVIAGNQFFSGPNFRIADLDVFSFVVPENSVLSFVTVEFGAFEFTGLRRSGFGPNYSIQRGPLTWALAVRRYVADRSASLHGRAHQHRPAESVHPVAGRVRTVQLDRRIGIHQHGLFAHQCAVGLPTDVRRREHRRPPEPAPLALLGFGLLALFVKRAGARSAFSRLR